jgi:sulfopyruvate decarboxylase TPP-binding subunit
MAQAQLVLDVLSRHGVTDVVSLPDNSSSALLALLRQSGEIRLLSVTREGEAFALAAGLWLGGRNPLVLIQNTGLLESGDSLRGTLVRMRIPVVCLVTYRGYAKFARLETPLDPSPEVLSRPDLDSVAVMTEPTLRAWGVPFDFLHTNEDIGKIAAAFAQAQQLSAPVAVLVTQDMN